MEIMNLAYIVDQETEYCVFINFSGHVQGLEVEIRESKSNWSTKVAEMDFYAFWNEKYKDIPYDDLKAKKLVLESILENHDIPYDMCVRIAETTYKHTF